MNIPQKRMYKNPSSRTLHQKNTMSMPMLGVSQSTSSLPQQIIQKKIIGGEINQSSVFDLKKSINFQSPKIWNKQKLNKNSRYEQPLNFSEKNQLKQSRYSEYKKRFKRIFDKSPEPNEQGAKRQSSNKSRQKIRESIDQLIEDKQKYYSFKMSLRSVLEQRKSQITIPSPVPYEEYLKNEKLHRQQALKRKEELEKETYKTRLFKLKLKDSRSTIKQILENKAKEKAQKLQLVKQWLSLIKLKPMLEVLSKNYNHHKVGVIKKQRATYLVCKFVRGYKRLKNKQGSNPHIRLVRSIKQQALKLKPSRALIFGSDLMYGLKQDQAKYKLFIFMKEAASRQEIADKMLKTHQRVVFIQKYWKRTTRTNILNKMGYLDQYWKRISEELHKYQSFQLQFKKITKNITQDQKKKILFQMVTKNLKKHVKLYLEWERFLKTCDHKTAAINRIVERFQTQASSHVETYIKSRIETEIQQFFDDPKLKKKKKRNYKNEKEEQEDDNKAIQQIQTTFNVKKTPAPRVSTIIKTDFQFSPQRTLKKAFTLSENKEQSKREKMMKKFLLEKQQYVSEAPKFELICSVEDFINTIKKGYEFFSS